MCLLCAEEEEAEGPRDEGAGTGPTAEEEGGGAAEFWKGADTGLNPAGSPGGSAGPRVAPRGWDWGWGWGWGWGW